MPCGVECERMRKRKYWRYSHGGEWVYRYERERPALGREADAKHEAYSEQVALDDREAAKRLEEQGKRKVEDWQMPS